MKKSLRIICLSSLLVVMAAACNIPAIQVGEKNGTVSVGTTIVEKTFISSTTSLEKSPAIGTDAIFTADKTVMVAVTITPSQLTPSSQTATITSTEDTNCRKGPGVMYEKVGELLVGQTSEAVAKYQNGKFWLIKNPANPAQECWVQGATTNVTGSIANLPEATPPATPDVTLNLTIYAIISPITYTGACPVTVELIGNFTINTSTVISYQWYLGDLLVTSGAVTAGSTGTFTSSDQITITSTTTDPIRLKASAPPKTVTTSPIGFSIICN
ncbi:MAG: hypothetical protein WCF08_01490 [Anaerolineaceae bacterium]